MPRRCERPACSAAAAVAYGFEAERTLVWLEAVDEAEAATVNAGVLCRRHADALRPPRGWYLDDRREVRPRLFVPPGEALLGDGESVPSAGVRPERARRVRRTRSDDPTLELSFDAPSGAGTDTDAGTDVAPEAGSPPLAATVAAPDIDPDETLAMPWTPVFDQTDDLGGLLDARSPLLARAFGRRPPERSGG